MIFPETNNETQLHQLIAQIDQNNDTLLLKKKYIHADIDIYLDFTVDNQNGTELYHKVIQVRVVNKTEQLNLFTSNDNAIFMIVPNKQLNNSGRHEEYYEFNDAVRVWSTVYYAINRLIRETYRQSGNKNMQNNVIVPCQFSTLLVDPQIWDDKLYVVEIYYVDENEVTWYSSFWIHQYGTQWADYYDCVDERLSLQNTPFDELYWCLEWRKREPKTLLFNSSILERPNCKSSFDCINNGFCYQSFQVLYFFYYLNKVNPICLCKQYLYGQNCSQQDDVAAYYHQQIDINLMNLIEKGHYSINPQKQKRCLYLLSRNRYLTSQDIIQISKLTKKELNIDEYTPMFKLQILDILLIRATQNNDIPTFYVGVHTQIMDIQKQNTLLGQFEYTKFYLQQTNTQDVPVAIIQKYGANYTDNIAITIEPIDEVRYFSILLPSQELLEQINVEIYSPYISIMIQDQFFQQLNEVSLNITFPTLKQLDEIYRPTQLCCKLLLLNLTLKQEGCRILKLTDNQATVQMISIKEPIIIGRFSPNKSVDPIQWITKNKARILVVLLLISYL